MKDTTKRSILRWTHIVFGLTLFGYILPPPGPDAASGEFLQRARGQGNGLTPPRQ